MISKNPDVGNKKYHCQAPPYIKEKPPFVYRNGSQLYFLESISPK